MIAAEVEHRTQAYGRELFARLPMQRPLPFTPAWFDDKLMNLTMSDETLKVELFRFIDALPALRDHDSVALHLREYLQSAGRKLPWWARWGTKLLPQRGLLAAWLARSARGNATHLAKRFISGSTVGEAIETVRELRNRSLAFTIDLLGEATITEAEADAVRDEYLSLLNGLGDAVSAMPEVPLIDRDDLGPIPRANVSVKLSALFSQFDPIDPAGTGRAVLARLRPILRRAREQNAFVNVDMEQFSFKDTTLAIFREVLTEPEFRDWPHVGIAIQAYLRETLYDLSVLRDWAHRRGTPITIRLVKGAYWDYETITSAREGWPVPVFTRKADSDANFEACAQYLMVHHNWLRPAFGSHNIRSISRALALADEYRVPPGRCEFQMLYGMADEIKDVLLQLNQRVRIYAPFGQLLPGMAYLVRRLLENTSNESFLRASFRDNISEETLLMNPVDHHRPKSEPVKHAGTTFRNEPLGDFSRETVRTRMQSAIDDVASQFGRDYPLFIDGKPLTTGRWIESLNPSHAKEVVGRAAAAGVEQANLAVQAAVRAFPAWCDADVSTRADALRRIAAGLRDRRFELSAWATHECGKPWREADADIAEAIDFCEYYALEMERMSKPQRRDMPGEDNEYFYEPRGVAVVIAPWNFPLAILCGMTTAAVVAGNTVIMKPAEQSSIIAAKFMEVIVEAGLPPGVVNLVSGIGEEIGPTLINHPDVALVAFTGSLNVGLGINRDASVTPIGQDHVRKVIAEMGGKNAVIVDSDADLDEAVKGIVDGAFGYQGQKCSAGSRAIVLAGVYDQFLHRLVEATKSLTIAPAESPGCSVGPVIDQEARDRILRTIEKGKGEARLAHATDVGTLASEGWYIGPHIFADVPETSMLAQDEIFGPVLAVIKAADFDDALRIANGTRFAMTGGVFSRSPTHIEQARRRFRVGNLYINRKCTGALVDRQPFGGFKLSGIGSKAGGPDYLLQFLLPRTITENTMRRGFAPVRD